jgi:hypothetical protein
MAIEGEHLPTEVGYVKVKTLVRTINTDELSLDGFWQFVQKFFGCANPQFHQLSGGWSQTIPQVKKLDVACRIVLQRQLQCDLCGLLPQHKVRLCNYHAV